ncbi:AEC family transporter [Dorea formicigenerans]|jgi:predicted permease|uniref:AEC family transporter n=2 Tax=Dorea formicigenerans TaxID=39486 RepID=A0A3E4FAG1_9FIRM|nr:AEC family transporter [Dorea formicigenerans]NSE47598.1 AEC family transporter [Dorea formicigenerans]RGI86602.1 AEC family transporter [Dorea formicigenerans]RGI89778.1 AEC family transporter [Dorea formicigenerans]RHA65552.1 AEC family transporter [Dorea formicigenerans]RHB40779.1 AEC family transporter [Dorea formicigenerans]
MVLLQQMGILFVYMMIGYVACKKEYFDQEFGKKLSWLVVNVANPMLAISAVVNNEEQIAKKDFYVTVLLAICFYAFFLILAQILPRLIGVQNSDIGVYKMMTTFNNIGFMGFPVIAAAYGNGALIYAVPFSIMFNILCYTWGIQTLCGGGEKGNWKRIINIGTISGIISIVLFFMQIPVPKMICSLSAGLSNLTGPLSMLVIGISIAAMELKDLFTDVKLLKFALIKLLAVPVAAMLLVCQVIDNRLICEVFLVMMATPAASMCAMLSQQYGGDYELAAKGVALTTILSVVTMPIVSEIVFHIAV